MRIEEMSQDRGGLLVKVAYWFSLKRFGKIADPVKVMCRHIWVLLGSGAFEMAVERSKKVDTRLKELAQIKVAALKGDNYETNHCSCGFSSFGSGSTAFSFKSNKGQCEAESRCNPRVYRNSK